MNQLACRRQHQRSRRKLGNLHGTAMLALSTSRRNQAPTGRERQASQAAARNHAPDGHSVRDAHSQRIVTERADFSAAQATRSPLLYFSARLIRAGAWNAYLPVL